MIGHVDSAQNHYDNIVATTLQDLSAPNQIITYSITMGMEVVACETHEDSFYETPAITVLWTVREGNFYDIAHLNLPMVPEPVEISVVQERIVECWEELVFSRQAHEMLELDQAMDGISDGDEPA